MTNAKPPRRGVPQPLLGGPQRFGPYSLQARLAVGGTSEVYLAELADREGSAPSSLPERIIVKRLLPHLVADAEGRTMFEREATLHAALHHPNVVSVFGSGRTEQGEPYLAMEYVDGCDAFRLLRRAVLTHNALPLGVSVYVAREALAGLAAVHDARDAAGLPLKIIHRDVTPSNIYLSRTGDVKLGDFGIARSLDRPPVPRAAGEIAAPDASLLGKFSYLSPEQVAGEPFDQRADLFSMATVLAEMVLGRPLFPGTGQLQVLLAIRDCELVPLREAKDSLPADLVAVLERALARRPDDRFQDAMAFFVALAPFVFDPSAARLELAARVKIVQTISSETKLAAVRESSRAMRAVRIDSSLTPAVHLQALDAPGDGVDVDFDEDDLRDENTGVYPLFQSFVERRSGGDRLGPWTFAHLVEAIATGIVKRGDRVDYIGMGLRPVEDIPDLARVLPAASAPDAPALAAFGTPAYRADLTETTMLDVLADILGSRHSGRLIIERPGFEGEGPQKREAFFLRGRLHHLASSNAGELLGDFLVRRGKLAREELDLALAVLPRHGGRMGETLIALGLVEAVDIVRAVRDQARDRLVEVFTWRDGSVELYPDAEVPAVEYPLDLDLPTLMLAGMEACHPGDAPMAFIEPRLDSVLVPNARPELHVAAWPPLVDGVLGAITAAIPLRDVLATVTKGGPASGADVARALELSLAMDLVRWE